MDTKTLALGDTAYFLPRSASYAIEPLTGEVTKISPTGQITVTRNSYTTRFEPKWGNEIGGGGRLIDSADYDYHMQRYTDRTARKELRGKIEALSSTASKEDILQSLREAIAFVEINLRSVDAA